MKWIQDSDGTKARLDASLRRDRFTTQFGRFLRRLPWLSHTTEWPQQSSRAGRLLATMEVSCQNYSVELRFQGLPSINPRVGQKVKGTESESMDQNLEKLCQVFIDVFDDEEIVLSRSTTAADIEDWDSLMHITLILEVEKSYGVRFSSGEVADLQDAGALMDAIEMKCKA